MTKLFKNKTGTKIMFSVSKKEKEEEEQQQQQQ